VRWLGLLLLGCLSLAVLSLSMGAAGHYPPWQWHNLPSAILTDLRLPRVLAGLAAGGLLGLAGALVQVLTRNPLADPYILGISGGAAVAALSAMLLGAGLLLQHVSAAIGALLVLALVLWLARSRQVWDGSRLILTGVVLATALGAVVTLLLSLAPDGVLRGMLFWLMGDLSRAPGGTLALVVLLMLLPLVLFLARDLDLLTRGDVLAATLGVRVEQVRFIVFVIAGLATAIAVITVGTIGFVGLIAPHMARLLVGLDHRRVLPASILIGAMLVVAADLIARLIIAPQQLPAGSILALIGAPIFLYLLYRHQGRYG